jgi:hypothetical protein
MPRELDTFRPQQNIYARAIKRRAKRIRVQSLTPLAISFLVTSAAILGSRESSRLDEVIAFDGGVSGRRTFVFAEMEVIVLAYFVRVLLALAAHLRLRLGRLG